MDIFKRIEMEVKHKRQEWLDQEDYERTMEREYQRLERERAIKVQADKANAVREEQTYAEYMREYERDSAKFGF